MSRPPKFLRYFYYIAYMWYVSYTSEKHTAQYTATIFLTIPHMMLILIGINFFFAGDFYENTNSYTGAIPIAFLILVFHYFWFLHKSQWKNYLREFDHLTRKNRRQGTVYLFLYIFIILVIIFPISIWVVVDSSPFYD